MPVRLVGRLAHEVGITPLCNDRFSLFLRHRLPGIDKRTDRARPAGSLGPDALEDEKRLFLGEIKSAHGNDQCRDVASVGDFTGALRAAELWLGTDPENSEAAEYAANCRVHLEKFYQSRLGSFERVVEVAVAQSEIRWLGLDHRAGFFLSRVDGMTTVDELLDLSGMPRLESLKTLVELLDMGAIRLA